MTIDSYEPIVKIGNTIYTKAAVFDVIGDVEMGETDSDRRRHLPFGGPFFSFKGFGGCMSFSPNSNNAFSNPSGFGHPSSNSPCSAFQSPFNGFSHSSDVMFGINHDHQEPHYMFSTHNDFHFSLGSSMYYQDNTLNLHIHFPFNIFGAMDQHFHVSAPFTPLPDVSYNFGCSFR